MQCTYCSAPASTRDHVPPRSLLEKPFPPNLRTVPACVRCNRGFSKDEEYLLVTLASIGTAPTLAAKIEEGGVVDRALARSARLDERIQNSLSVTEDGRVVLTPELDRVHRIVRKIAHGLYVLRYGVQPGVDGLTVLGVFPYNLTDSRPTQVFGATYQESFRAKRWVHIQPGVFSELWVRNPSRGPALMCVMDFHQTAWGVVLARAPSNGARRSARLPSIFDPVPSV